MFWRQAVVHANDGNTGAVTDFGTDIVMAFEAPQHVAAAMEIKHHGQVF